MRSSTLAELLAVGMIAASTAGCGGAERATVSGQVKDAGGLPIVGALVIARSDETGASASGETGSDGRYELGGSQSGDGVVPGSYSVTVLSQRKGLQDAGGASPPKVPARFGSHTTSGLQFSVEAGESKEFDIILDAS